MELLVGCVAGFCIGATGVGGGLLAAPLLILVFGVPAEAAIATSTLFLALVRLYAGSLYYRRGQVVWPMLGRLLFGGVPGALIGPWLLGRSAAYAPAGALMFTVGLVVILSAGISLFLSSFRAGASRRVRPGFLPWAGFLMGSSLGLSSAGAGTLGALALLHLTDLEPSFVVGTNIVAGLALSMAAGFGFLLLGSVSGALLGKLALGGLIGVFGGVLVGARIRVAGLRTAISVWALALGLILAGHGLREWLADKEKAGVPLVGTPARIDHVKP